MKADREVGAKVDGVAENKGKTYEFAGTRAKRLKEMRYMYKWKDVGIDDINEDAHPEDYVIGNEGWREMDYGAYDSKKPQESKLTDYIYEGFEMGELGFFYYVVVGADLYGVLPNEIADVLKAFATGKGKSLDLKLDIAAILDDEKLKHMEKDLRKSHLMERQKLMRAFVADLGCLNHRDHPNGNRALVRKTALPCSRRLGSSGRCRQLWNITHYLFYPLLW